MSSIKDRFKPTNMEAVKEQDRSLNDQFYANRPGFINLKEGSNIVRIWPAHPDDQNPMFIHPKFTHTLPFATKDDDGKIKVGFKPIFNAKVHGGFKKDVIEEYFNFCKTYILEKFTGDKEKIALATNAINGYRANGKWVSGLWVNKKHVMYASLLSMKEGKLVEDEFGRLEINDQVKRNLKQLCASQDDDGGVIEVDAFTDPDTGLLVEFTHNPKAKDKRDITTVKFFTKNFQNVPFALTEAQLESFIEKESLEKLYQNSYKKKDFELALEGLAYFDKKNGIGAFEEMAWLEVIKKLKQDFNFDEADSEETLSISNPLQEWSKEKLLEFLEVHDFQYVPRKTHDIEKILEEIVYEVAENNDFNPEDEMDKIYSAINRLIKLSPKTEEEAEFVSEAEVMDDLKAEEE